MNTPQDPREQPLTSEEAELARVLRALPGGEPSARVDAAILRAATDAVAGQGGAVQPKQPRRRLPAWALGTAAAAVLAVFVGSQLRPEMTPAPRELTAEAPAEPAAAAKAEAPSAQDAAADTTLETQELPAPAAYRVAPPPPPPPAPEAPRASGIEAEARQAAERAAAQAAAEAEARATERARSMAEAEAARRAQARQAAEADAAPPTASAPPEAPPELQPTEAAGESRAQGFERRDTGADSAPLIFDEPSPVDIVEPVPAPPPPPMVAPAAPPPALPPVGDDRLLAPEDWIERIRMRRDIGDDAGARASLALLRREHPDLPLPADLADLLK
ncbi:MAG TPA: hypothetical protein VKZ64_04360 [Arenimonas sp.]|nr:hypothetical protein [Arenimonas sp.]